MKGGPSAILHPHPSKAAVPPVSTALCPPGRSAHLQQRVGPPKSPWVTSSTCVEACNPALPNLASSSSSSDPITTPCGDQTAPDCIKKREENCYIMACVLTNSL
ncbi:hypothetical protein AALO_G00051750 [Alosa alosa]|uniref:Uncharacterized protein n=1 Tax=Alosa alosa TaxID=278164 RepID=A0AAV6H9H0_9TELE|nr:hypothetical protein AALO_G00051750 [Alosa alosa]